MWQLHFWFSQTVHMDSKIALWDSSWTLSPCLLLPVLTCHKWPHCPAIGSSQKNKCHSQPLSCLFSQPQLKYVNKSYWFFLHDTTWISQFLCQSLVQTVIFSLVFSHNFPAILLSHLPSVSSTKPKDWPYNANFLPYLKLFHHGAPNLFLRAYQSWKIWSPITSSNSSFPLFTLLQPLTSCQLQKRSHKLWCLQGQVGLAGEWRGRWGKPVYSHAPFPTGRCFLAPWLLNPYVGPWLPYFQIFQKKSEIQVLKVITPCKNTGT